MSVATSMHIRLSIAVLLASLAWGGPGFASSVSTDGSKYSTEVAGCKERGGVLGSAGISDERICIVPFKDAGKICKGRADCTGVCKAPSQVSAVTEGVVGSCQRDVTDGFGCYSQIIDGRAMPAVCVD
jgi:hypothetical protein